MVDYERIQKPQSASSSSQATAGAGGGGISPSKLRLMLLGVERRRKQEEAHHHHHDQEEQLQALRSVAPPDADFRRSSSVSESTVKDVAVVITGSPPDRTSALAVNRHKDLNNHPSKQQQPQHPSSSRSYDDDGPSDSDGAASSSSGAFEFQRADRAPPHRSQMQQQQGSAPTNAAPVVPPFSKPAPSKWDDAQKWIASPTSTRQPAQLRKVAGGNNHAATRMGAGGSGKVMVDVGEEPADTKRIDQSQQQPRRKDSGSQMQAQKGTAGWAVPDPCPVAAAALYTNKHADYFDTSLTDAAAAINLSQHDAALSAHPTTAFIPPPPSVTVRSVSMRDMGTEMTPIASQEPSRTGTPIRATTPVPRSPSTSTPSSPDRGGGATDSGLKSTEKEDQMRTRMEIIALGTKLGKPNIAAWASREDEEKDANAALKALQASASQKRNEIEMRAAAWEEAEKAKYIARFKREEIKIEAWENHKKAKTEAEMKKVEVEVERIKAHAHDKLMKKLADARHRAEEKRAAAEAKRSRQAAKIAEQAEYIRRTGRVPPSFFHWSCCK